MKRILPILLLLLSGVAAVPAGAEAISGLYEVEVPVSDRGQTARKQALLDAFRGVLVKVSGYSGVLDDPAVAEAATRVDDYVEQFRYRQERSGSGPLTLWVRFNGSGVEQLLEQHELPVWGRARPVMVVWLAVEENGRRELVGSGDSTYAPAIVERAARRGIPLRLPMLDLTDRSNISASDVWGDFRGTILEASRRYDAQVILTGRLYQGRAGSWRVRWALYGGGEAVHWEERGDDLGTVLATGLDAGVDTVSLRYTRHGNAGDSAIELRVEAISNLSDYNRALQYLEGVNGVAQVDVVEMGSDYAAFRLELSGPRAGVVEALSLGDVLDAERPAGAVEGPEGSGSQLVYRLLK